MVSKRGESVCPKTGKAHFWLTRGEQEDKVSSIDTIWSGRLWRRCRECGEEDCGTALCEAVTSSYSGGWPRYGNCGRLASTAHAQDRDGKEDGLAHGYCRAHDPDAVAAKRAERLAKGQAKLEREAREHRLGWAGGEALEYLRELAEWLLLNRDLAAADEWLRQLDRRLPPLIDRMGGTA